MKTDNLRPFDILTGVLLLMLLVVAIRASGESKAQATAPERPVIVCLGDSITEGAPGYRNDPQRTLEAYGKENNPQSRYAYWLAEKYPNAVIIPKGISCNTTTQMLDRFRDDVIFYHPDYVIIMGGTNDVCKGETAKIAPNLSAMICIAKDHGITPVLCTPPPIENTDYRREMSKAAEAIRQVAEFNDIRLADCYIAFGTPLHSDAPKNGLLADGIHPTVAGYRLIGDKVADALHDANCR